MKVKIGLFSSSFHPDVIGWKNQSSLACEFGFWKNGRRNIFVKRFRYQPTGWNLLKELLTHPISNTPKVYDLKQNDSYHYVFAKALQGDTFRNLFLNKSQNTIFGNKELAPQDRFQIAFSVYKTLRSINQRGYWYPDLDFKNLFISPFKKSYRVYLIDIDSCAPHDYPFEPGDVSQVFWEGLAKTYKNLGKKFLIKNSLGKMQIVPKGNALNQSMSILFAYAMQRFGFVPTDLSLFEPLISSKSPHSSMVSSIHNQLATNKGGWDEVEIFLSCFFKVPKFQFFKYSQKYLTPKTNLFSFLQIYKKLGKN